MRVFFTTGIPSNETSFVAVDSEAKQDDKLSMTMQKRKVPSQMAHGWGGGIGGGMAYRKITLAGYIEPPVYDRNSFEITVV